MNSTSMFLKYCPSSKRQCSEQEEMPAGGEAMHKV